MKQKVIGLAMVLLMAGTTGFAQQKPFQFGIKFAPNISWLKTETDGYENEGAGIGFAWGFVADFTLTENYYVSTGFDVTWNNAGISYPFDDQVLNKEGVLYRDYKLKYLQIPLTLKMKTNKFNEKHSFYGQLGLGSGFRIGAKAKDQFEYTDESGQKIKTPEEESNITDDINIFKASLIVGGGMQFHIDESTLLFVGINYNNGFSNILEGNNNVDGTLKQKAQLHYLELSVGVIF